MGSVKIPAKLRYRSFCSHHFRRLSSHSFLGMEGMSTNWSTSPVLEPAGSLPNLRKYRRSSSNCFSKFFWGEGSYGTLCRRLSNDEVLRLTVTNDKADFTLDFRGGALTQVNLYITVSQYSVQHRKRLFRQKKIMATNQYPIRTPGGKVKRMRNATLRTLVCWDSRSPLLSPETCCGALHAVGDFIKTGERSSLLSVRSIPPLDTISPDHRLLLIRRGSGLSVVLSAYLRRWTLSPVSRISSFLGLFFVDIST